MNDPYPPPPLSAPRPASAPRRRMGCLTVLLVLLLAASVFVNLALFGALGMQAGGEGRIVERKLRDLDETVLEEAKAGSSDKIALIRLTGVIAYSVEGTSGESMVSDLKKALQQAAKDDAVKAILLVVESPGGEVTASDTLYHAVRTARGKKPVVVYMQSVAASGGYYVACGGSWLMAADTTITGSIGVIWQTLQYKELLGKIGLGTLTFKSGKFKDLLNGAREVTQEEVDYVQGMVMQTYERFLRVVAAERKLDADAIREGVADGRIFSGTDAKSNGLIDDTGYIEDAVKKARELGKAEHASVVEYSARFSLAKLFRMLGEARSERTTVRLDLGQGAFPQLEPGKLYLLPPHLVGAPVR